MRSPSSTFGSSNSNGELSGAGTSRVADEARLVHGQHPVFDARTVDLDPSGIRSSGHANGEGRALNVDASVLNGKLVFSGFLFLKGKKHSLYTSFYAIQHDLPEVSDLK